MLCFHPPQTFETIYGLLKPIMEERTIAKVKVTSDSSSIAEWIDDETRTEDLGGKHAAYARFEDVDYEWFLNDYASTHPKFGNYMRKIRECLDQVEDKYDAKTL